MEEKDLIELGFTKEYGEDFYYYTYDIDEFNCFLISSDNEDKDKWWVEVFESNRVRFTDKNELKLLIDLIKRNENKRI
jgi:hypothetical protein